METFEFLYVESCNNLKLSPSEKILSAIKNCFRSTTLNLSDIILSSETATCKCLGQAFAKDVHVTELDCRNCLIFDDGLSNILLGLEKNKFLQILNLEGNNIRSVGTEALGKFLRHNNHLQILNLQWNGTGMFQESFSAFCEGLCNNTSLKSLDLRHNQLNNHCAQSISEVILRNTTLQKLDLRWNSIGLIGARSILKSLLKNRTLFQLEVSGNDLTSDLLEAIERIKLLQARHAEEITECEFLHEKQMTDLKLKFSEEEKILKKKIALLISKEKDLEQELKEKNSQVYSERAHAEKMQMELEKKMKLDHEAIRQQLEERIEMLEDTNKEQNDHLQRDLHTLYQMKADITSLELEMAEQAHEIENLRKRLAEKDSDVKVQEAKIKLEVKEQLEELQTVKEKLKEQEKINDKMQQEMLDLVKVHKDALYSKDELIHNLERDINVLKDTRQRMIESDKSRNLKLQEAFEAFLNSSYNDEKLSSTLNAGDCPSINTKE